MLPCTNLVLFLIRNLTLTSPFLGTLESVKSLDIADLFQSFSRLICNLSEEDLEKFFGEQHISHSSSKRLNNFYQALAFLEAEEAAVLSCFSLLSKEKKAAVYEILAGLITPDNK